MPILNDIKTALRISEGNTAYEGEILDLIAAARADLRLSGILESKVNDDIDPLIKRAITVYVKAHFGWNNPDAEKLQQSYAMIKGHLALSQEYTKVVE